MTNHIATTPETAGARQILFGAADHVTRNHRLTLFRAIAHLDTTPRTSASGFDVAVRNVERAWKATR